MKKTSTKRALLSAILALVMTVSMLVGTTFAWFTDSVTSAGNKIVAGNLDVELHMYNGSAYVDISNATKPIFGADGLAAAADGSSTLWEPGKTQVVYLAIKNNGSLALKYKVALNVTGIEKDLDKVLTYTITPDAQAPANMLSGWDATGAKSVKLGSQVVSAPSVPLNAGGMHYFALAVHMDELAGNEYMGASISFDLTVLATQLSSEEDSFGPSYDDGAGFQEITSPSIDRPTTGGTEDITFTSASGVSAKVPAEVLDAMPAEVTEVSLNHSAPKIDGSNVVFDAIDFVDQNGNVIDLSANTVPVEVKLPLGDAIAAGTSVLIYHDGVLVDDAVVDAEGNIVYNAAHFCEVEVVRVGDDEVVRVGSNVYASLAEAIEAAEDGATLTVINNIAFDADNYSDNNGYFEGWVYDGDKSFTLDLNGFRLYNDNSKVNDYLLFFRNNGAKANSITIKNGEIDAGESAYAALATASSNAQTINLDIENVRFNGNNQNGAVVKLRGGVQANLKAGTVVTGADNYTAVEVVGEKTVVNVYDGAEFYQNGTTNYVGSALGVSYGATLNVYGGKGVSAKAGLIVMSSGGTLNVYGGEWTANGDGTYGNGNASVLISQRDTAAYKNEYNSVLNVYGGDFKGGYNCYADVVDRAFLNIYGGNFNADPSEYVATAYSVASKDGSYTVMKSADYLAALLANGGKVVLDKDYIVDAPIVIPEDVVADLDLNGKTITGIKGRDADNNRIHVIVNNGILTIKDGTVKSAGNDGGSAIYNNAGATLTIEDVTLYGAPQSDPVYEVGVSKPFPSYAVNNYGDAVINGATIRSYHGAVATGDNGTTVINDADIDVGLGQSTGITSYLIYSFGNAQVTVNDGKFAFTKQEIYVNGGNTFCELGTNPIIINGGNYIGTSFSIGEGREYVINGGTFDADPTKFLAAGVKSTKSGELYYVTAPDLIPVADAASLVEAVKADGKVVLYADIALESTLTIAGNIELDLNGYVLSGACNASQGHLIMVPYGTTLTVTDSSADESGKITFAQGSSNVGWTIDLEGTLNLESGTIELTGSWSIGYAVDVRPNAWGSEYTEATVFNMNGGKLVSSDGAVRVASSSSDSYAKVEAVFNMNGGEIFADWDGVFIQQSNAAYDTLTVNLKGGKITSKYSPIRFYGPVATSVNSGAEKPMTLVIDGTELVLDGVADETAAWYSLGVIKLGGGVTKADVDNYATVHIVVHTDNAADLKDEIENGDADEIVLDGDIDLGDLFGN